ncbi:hypothetical protein CC86DRAFT_142790 [Ophiobolus disseminans]|uniref:Uncharacterized protein n=1 Tax=Ophiobolus disseminans TaxID=1469910 RepID=A0A6A7AEI2_9PLEO|nr:hypothetical protein CC86DRAFT_142790 [Ophiobolus disseminans]
MWCQAYPQCWQLIMLESLVCQCLSARPIRRRPSFHAPPLYGHLLRLRLSTEIMGLDAKPFGSRYPRLSPRPNGSGIFHLKVIMAMIIEGHLLLKENKELSITTVAKLTDTGLEVVIRHPHSWS